ncbi:unnamed protein product [Miscanthus lutarioriparius]|uniref:Uncharacterized protein n=1 Tax=Miscanthus lutarioriparius TaxID=422564 RepID=A0A811RU06_9POAL|nr:unnamed protein product [Miscanthus lutarioriparius]
MMSKTNYYSWAALMMLQLHARSLWPAVNVKTTDFADDRNALEAIALGISPELQGSIARKPTAKAAWDSLKKTHLGVDRMSQARANMIHRESNTLQFKNAELMDDFGARITDLANQLQVLNVGYMEPEIIVMVIKTLLDLDNMPVEELIGRLKAIEERHDLGGGAGSSTAHLNLMEEELVASRLVSRLQLFGEGTPMGDLHPLTRGSSAAVAYPRAGGVVEALSHPSAATTRRR